MASTPLFPNYMQMQERVPLWVWHTLRVVAVGVIMLISGSMTDWRLSIARIIPLRIHEMTDLMLGAVLIQLIRQSIRTLQQDQNYEWIIIGVAIVLAVLIDQATKAIANRRLAAAAAREKT